MKYADALRISLSISDRVKVCLLSEYRSFDAAAMTKSGPVLTDSFVAIVVVDRYTAFRKSADPWVTGSSVNGVGACFSAVRTISESNIWSTNLAHVILYVFRNAFVFDFDVVNFDAYTNSG